jgi:hypothetical protein
MNLLANVFVTHPVASWIIAVIIVLFLIIFFLMLPELRRYMRIERM